MVVVSDMHDYNLETEFSKKISMYIPLSLHCSYSISVISHTHTNENYKITGLMPISTYL